MKIIEKTIFILEFDLTEEKYVSSIHESDLIMCRGDTYTIIEIEQTRNGYKIKIELFRRAINFYSIDMENNLYKVADYNLNCIMENKLW